MIANAAEKYAAGKYDAYFFNIRKSHHVLLKERLKRQGISAAKPMLGDGIAELKGLIAGLCDETLFLYIDPFGLNCDFDVLRPLLERDNRHSTEILINLSMPISHRLSSRLAMQNLEAQDQPIDSFHQKLTRVYGGEYWRDSLLSDDYSDAKERERVLIRQYCSELKRTEYLTYAGACPIREKSDSATKYFMVFASPHPDALLLLNDSMCKSFEEHMQSQWAKETMFADLPWTEWRDPLKLQELVVDYVDSNAGANRKEIWVKIVQDHFMLFTSSEYKKAVKANCDSNRLVCETPVAKGGVRPTRMLNDECVFGLPKQQTML